MHNNPSLWNKHRSSNRNKIPPTEFCSTAGMPIRLSVLDERLSAPAALWP